MDKFAYYLVAAVLVASTATGGVLAAVGYPFGVLLMAISMFAAVACICERD